MSKEKLPAGTIKRGNYYGRVDKDGGVHINYGQWVDYPESDSILWKINVTDIDDMIAMLTALKRHNS